MREFIDSFILKLFDWRVLNIERGNFFKRLIKLSSKGVIYSCIAIGFLIMFDYLVIRFYEILLAQNSESIACRFGETNLMFTMVHGLMEIDYLIEVINVSAGILGVLLGLFYTAFLTILATKYSNINSTIGSLLLEQKPLNRFFILLATLTAFSIIFELLLSSGYQPTLGSSAVFIFLVISTLVGFTSFGKFALVYFDTSSLVYDLIDKNNVLLVKIRNHTQRISSLSRGQQYTRALYTNVKHIGIIVNESKKPEVGNTSFKTILSKVGEFSLHYNQAKHYIPASDDWHIKVNKPKRWENAQEWDFSLLKTTGVDIRPDTVKSFNLLELTITNIQFEILDHHVQGIEQLSTLFNQDKYVHNIAYQFDFETFSSYFLSLEKFIKDRISKSTDLVYRVQLSNAYSYLLIQYLVGYNAHLGSHLVSANLNQMSLSIFNFKPHQKPYFLKDWEESFCQKLITEKKIEGSIKTPLVFVRYELAEQSQYHIQNHYKQVTGFVVDKVTQFVKFLKNESHNVEALQLALTSIELRRKMEHFLEETVKTIDGYSNFEKQLSEKSFQFTKYDEFKKQYQLFEKLLLNTIWDLGVTAYDIDDKNLPDLYGNFYHLILNDLTSKILDKSTPESELKKLIIKFNIASIIYLESLRARYRDAENIQFVTSKLYPFIVDLMEINSLILIRSIGLSEVALRDAIFKYWDSEVEEMGDKVSFWRYILSIYNYYQMPRSTWSSASISKEHVRRNMLQEFLISENIVVKKSRVRSGLGFSEEYYDSNLDNVYLKAIARGMDEYRMNFFNIHEFFVEHYLRLSVDLKDIDIKETRYGKSVRTYME